MFLTTELLTQTSWVLTLILLPASRGSVICHGRDLGVTRVLFADRLTPSRWRGWTQTAPVQKPLCTQWTQANERSKRLSLLAHAWSCLDVPTLCLDQSWSTSPPALPTVKTHFCLSTKDAPRQWADFPKSEVSDLYSSLHCTESQPNFIF